MTSVNTLGGSHKNVHETSTQQTKRTSLMMVTWADHQNLDFCMGEKWAPLYIHTLYMLVSSGHLSDRASVFMFLSSEYD